MSNFSAGTLVMYRPPLGRSNGLVPAGAVGEVKDSAKFSSEVPVGEVVVEFPRNRSDGYTGWWNVPTTWLIPLSDPDIDVTEDEKQPVEEGV